MLVLAVPLALAFVVLLLLAAVRAEQWLRCSTARMVVGSRWSPEEAEAIVARELANMFARQEAVRARSKPHGHRSRLGLHVRPGSLTS